MSKILLTIPLALLATAVYLAKPGSPVKRVETIHGTMNVLEVGDKACIWFDGGAPSCDFPAPVPGAE